MFKILLSLNVAKYTNVVIWYVYACVVDSNNIYVRENSFFSHRRTHRPIIKAFFRGNAL